MAEAFVDPAITPPDEGAQGVILLDLIQQINQETSLERVSALVADALRQIFSIDRFAIVLLQPDWSFQISSSRGLSEEYLRVVRENITKGAGARALAQRKPLYVIDAPESVEFEPLQEAARQEGFRSVLIIPLFLGVDPLGYLIMYHDRIRVYTPAEVVLAHALAQHAAFAVKNSRLRADNERYRADLEQRFDRRVAEAEAADEIMQGISASLDLESTLTSIVDIAARLSGAGSACIYLQMADGRFHPRAATGISLDRLQRIVLSPTDGLLGEMYRTRQPVEVADYLGDVQATPESRSEVERMGVRATVAVPLLRDREVVGALYVGKPGMEGFPPETVRILQRLTSFAQVALDNAKRFSDVTAERARLQMYFDAIPEGVIIYERDGRIALMNSTFRHAFGLQASIEPMTRNDLVHTPEGSQDQAVIFRYDTDAVFQRVLETGKPEQGLLEVRDTARTYEVHFNALRPGTDEPQGVMATIRDITAPLELERERSRSHLLAQLLELSAVLDATLAIPDLIERVVEAAVGLVGSHAGTIGLLEGNRIVFRRIWVDGVWSEVEPDLAHDQGITGRVMKTLQPYVTNNWATDPHVLPGLQQRFRFHRLVSVPMLDRKGNLVGTLEVHDPIVERDFGQLDIEALQVLAHQAAIAIENARLSRMKDEFLSIVSHELKTPVTSIKGFTQILQRRLPPQELERTGRYLDVLNSQADRLTRLINDLLDLSRIQQGRFRFDTGVINYGQLIRDVVQEMQLVAPRNRLTLESPDQVLVSGNGDRLRQVLINLVDNAVKYGPPEGEISLTVEEHDDGVHTYVCDEGNGLPQGEEERIFSQYYQLQQPDAKNSTGLGLGLFVSRQIVEGHGGRIWLDTNDHTSFCFTIPQV